MARGQPTFVADRDPVQEMVERLETSSTQLDTLEKQLEKVNEWWQHQPDDASKTIQRASVAMGIDPCKHKGATTDDTVLKVMTVALLMHS